MNVSYAVPLYMYRSVVYSVDKIVKNKPMINAFSKYPIKRYYIPSGQGLLFNNAIAEATRPITRGIWAPPTEQNHVYSDTKLMFYA